MEWALAALLPKIIRDRHVDWKIINHGSKQRLLDNLPGRLKGYRALGDATLRILVLVDRDADDCRALKARLEAAAVANGLATKSRPKPDGRFQVVNRIVIEELEAWFLGDATALSAAFSRVSAGFAGRRGVRDPDAVKGGAWEALLRILQAAGYYSGIQHLPKIEVAQKVAPHLDPMSGSRNRSRSFRAFVTGLDALIASS